MAAERHSSDGSGAKGSGAERVWRFDIIVCEGFVLTELSAVVEVLRIANRVLAQPPFVWTLRSATGGKIGCRAGLWTPTEVLSARPDADFAFFLGNSDPDHPGLAHGRSIVSYTSRGAKVYLLAEAAARYIRDHGSAAGRLTTHWENSTLLRERLGLADASHALASEDGQLVTCAGMNATLDVMLALVGRLTSAAAQVAVGNILLHERVRDLGSLQPFAGVRPTVTGDSDLDHCIRVMQDNIEEPVPISDLVTQLDISTRSLERKFRSYLGTTPNGFYREMRLSRANNLLLNTSMSVREIGLACGFPNGFSSLYRQTFGITPLTLRKRRRADRDVGRQTASAAE